MALVLTTSTNEVYTVPARIVMLDGQFIEEGTSQTSDSSNQHAQAALKEIKLLSEKLSKIANTHVEGLLKSLLGVSNRDSRIDLGVVSFKKYASQERPEVIKEILGAQRGSSGNLIKASDDLVKEHVRQILDFLGFNFKAGEDFRLEKQKGKIVYVPINFLTYIPTIAFAKRLGGKEKDPVDVFVSCLYTVEVESNEGEKSPKVIGFSDITTHFFEELRSIVKSRQNEQSYRNKLKEKLRSLALAVFERLESILGNSIDPELILLIASFLEHYKAASMYEDRKRRAVLLFRTGVDTIFYSSNTKKFSSFRVSFKKEGQDKEETVDFDFNVLSNNVLSDTIFYTVFFTDPEDATEKANQILSNKGNVSNVALGSMHYEEFPFNKVLVRKPTQRNLDILVTQVIGNNILENETDSGFEIESFK